MIRDATIEDIPRLVVWGRQFFEETEWHQFSEFHEVDFAALLRRAIEDESAIVVMSDKGFAVATVGPSIFDASLKGAQDLVVWGDGTLLTALEDRAREKGAKVFMMAAQARDNLRPAVMARWLRRQGYVPLESYYMRIL